MGLHCLKDWFEELLSIISRIADIRGQLKSWLQDLECTCSNRNVHQEQR